MTEVSFMHKSQLRDARALSRESALSLTHVQLGTTGNRTSACRLFQIYFAQVQLGQNKFEKVGRQKCVCANFRAINVYNPVILHYL